MKFLHLFFVVTIAAALSARAMEPTRKGNENFPPNPLEQDTDAEPTDSPYPAFNVHFNFEPKDWREIEMNLLANAEFLREIDEEQTRMARDGNKIAHVLNLQKDQMDELLLMVKQIQWRESKGRDSVDSDIPYYLRTGTIENESENRKRNVRTYDDLNAYAINKEKYSNGYGLYYNLMGQWI